MRALLCLIALGLTLNATGCYAAASVAPADTSYEPADLQRPATAGMAAESAQLGAAVRPAVAVDPPPVETQQHGRFIVYSGLMYLVAENLQDTFSAIESIAASMGGYMHALAEDSIIVKVPAPRFADTMDAVAQLGQVTSRHVKAADVTDQMRDLRIRLDNALAARKRLLAMLEKAQKVEDLLAIEAQLQRVTETVELLKGKLRFHEHEVAFATLAVHVNSPVPQHQINSPVPFAWVRDLGREMREPGGSAAYAQRRLARGVRLTLPGSYVRYYQQDYVTRAVSADNVMVIVRRHDNFDNGRLAFWSALARRSLRENAVVKTDVGNVLKLGRGQQAGVLVGSKQVGVKRMGYMLALVVTKRHVYSFEAWGPADAFAEAQPDLEMAVRSMQVGS